MRSRIWKAAAGLSLALVLLASLATLLPLIPVDSWYIRVLAFPRLQIWILLAVALIVALFVARPLRAGGRGVMLLGLVALVYGGWTLGRFLPLQDAQAEARCEEDAQVRILVANLKRGNESFADLEELVREETPDLFLAMETDPWWDEQLKAIGGLFQQQVDQVANAEKYYGIHLYSNLPLIEPEVVFLVDNGVPAISARVETDGGTAFNFLGLHPKPPHMMDTARYRDTHLRRAAAHLRDQEGPGVLAGDLNAVPWERIFREMEDEGDLRDPRHGRGFYHTYQVGGMGALWPLDHVLFRGDVDLKRMERGRDINSDHLPLVTDLCIAPRA